MKYQTYFTFATKGMIHIYITIAVVICEDVAHEDVMFSRESLPRTSLVFT